MTLVDDVLAVVGLELVDFGAAGPGDAGEPIGSVTAEVECMSYDEGGLPGSTDG